MMGWILLILGLGLWSAAHTFKRWAPARRAAMGDAAKGAVALVSVAGIVVMVIGYRMLPVPPQIWTPPPFMIHINNLLVLIALYMMSPAPKMGRLLRGMRHPMLTGFILWGVAHLLVNGDAASLVLFGWLTLWALAEIAIINRAEPEWAGRGLGGTWAMDGAMLAGSVVLLVVIGYIHFWLGYWPFPV